MPFQPLKLNPSLISCTDHFWAADLDNSSWGVYKGYGAASSYASHLKYLLSKDTKYVSV